LATLTHGDGVDLDLPALDQQHLMSRWEGCSAGTTVRRRRSPRPVIRTRRVPTPRT
jgi:hypothetical protein